MGETVLNSTSNTMIYDRAVQQMDATSQCIITSQKSASSSSEDNGIIDTSDKMIEVTNQVNNIVIFQERSGSSGGNRDCDGDHFYDREPEPGPSNYHKDSVEVAREHSAEMTREAEASMVRVFDPKGKQDSVPNIEQGKVNHYVEADRSPNHMGIRHLPAEVDEDYLLVGNYVEDHIRQRIKNGEYVDFARLLPRDRLVMDEDNQMEIVNRNGKMFFVPANDNDTSGVTNFSRWEQAFRVYSNIYTRKYPDRSSELIQYNHIIHTAALSSTWDNVYLYDRDFRFHLSRYPNRSWAVILQQAWTMQFKDCNKHDSGNQGSQIRGQGKF